MTEPLDLFRPEADRVAAAVLAGLASTEAALGLPVTLAPAGLEPEAALALVAPYVRGGARDLADPGFLAHMDPPTPWVAWVAALLGASSNQNLLHPDTAPAARELETTVIDWLAPVFGADGGHLVPGSTVANLTALWAARDLTGATTVVSSAAAHLSIAKAARILGLAHRTIEPDETGRLTAERLDRALADRDGPEPTRAILVLTAGTTGVGAIDELAIAGSGAEQGSGPGEVAWTHVDAAWAGPMRFSPTHRAALDGIEWADSIAVSAHKWLHQPKESAVVLFRDVERANEAISVGGAYLAVPNVGLLGSHGTAAAPLAATLLTLGLTGIADLIDIGMATADRLLAAVDDHPDLEAFAPNASGVVAWRHRRVDAGAIRATMTGAFVSTVELDGSTWLRSVAANPLADPELVVDRVLAAAATVERAAVGTRRVERRDGG